MGVMGKRSLSGPQILWQCVEQPVEKHDNLYQSNHLGITPAHLKPAMFLGMTSATMSALAATSANTSGHAMGCGMGLNPPKPSPATAPATMPFVMSCFPRQFSMLASV